MKQHDWLNTSPKNAEESGRLQLDQLNERMSAAKAAKVAASQAERQLDESSWRCGYDYMTEGGLGDF
tara:strand:- start:447 stop:647 length:201 start_codon:yes stop_codon:yes gene_type:complete